MVTPRGTDKAKVIQVIETQAIRGAGIKEDPVRTVIQYWDFDGNLLAENDTLVGWVNDSIRFIYIEIVKDKENCGINKSF